MDTETRQIEGRISKKEKCLRCGYVWFTRKQQKPKVCANCRSPYWNIPKKQKNLTKRLELLKKSLN